MDAPNIVDRSIQRYFGWAEGSNKARKALPGHVIDIPSIEIVKKPAETLNHVYGTISPGLRGHCGRNPLDYTRLYNMDG